MRRLVISKPSFWCRHRPNNILHFFLFSLPEKVVVPLVSSSFLLRGKNLQCDREGRGEGGYKRGQTTTVPPPHLQKAKKMKRVLQQGSDSFLSLFFLSLLPSWGQGMKKNYYTYFHARKSATKILAHRRYAMKRGGKGREM